MKILCYGDSNTWGYSPFGGGRFGTDTRWPAVMAECLGPEYHIIEEGLNGRTIGNFMSPGNPLNGLEYLHHIFEKYPPESLGIVIIYLGINDLFQRENIGAEEIARDIGYAVELIRDLDGAGREGGSGLAILLVPPPPLNIPEELSGIYRLQMIKAESFYDEYRKIAVARGPGVSVIDTGSVISASTEDGVHLEAEEHRKLGRYLCGWIIDKLAEGVT